MKYFLDFLLLVIIYFAVFFNRWKWKGKYNLIMNSVMYVYLCGVIHVTLMPIVTSIPSISFRGYVPINLIPFVDVINGWGDFYRQIVLNVVMMMPFGFLIPLVRPKQTEFKAVFCYTFLISLSIELLQPLINAYRSADITDVITNTVGGLLGYMIYLAVSRKVKAKRCGCIEE